ncbi:GQ67_04194T1 [Komagataella phaffii]|nr:GQ67_04194T1 [Komagataella phaffii]AOA68624.1 GQ68_04167T1 [Komagataella phaffii GS115]
MVNVIQKFQESVAIRRLQMKSSLLEAIQHQGPFSINSIKEISSNAFQLADSDVNDSLHDTIMDSIEEKKALLNELYHRIDSWDKMDSKDISHFVNINSQLHDLIVLQTLDPVLSASKLHLVAFESLLSTNLQVKFAFHFSGKKKTNNISKPEWWVDYLLKWLDQHASLFNLHFSVSLKDTIYQETFFIDHLITAVREICREKICSDLDMLLAHENQSLLTHFIGELRRLDKSLSDNFYWSSSGFIDTFILENDQVFATWLQNECRFSFNRFDDIINTDLQAFEIDLDSNLKGEVKSTKSSLNLKILIENTTKNYENMNNLNKQLKFLSEIQLALLNSYYQRLEEGLKSFESIYMKRPIDHNSSLNASSIERLFRIICSLKFMIFQLEHWSQELVFVSLWEVINKDRSATDNSSSTTFFYSIISHYQKLVKKCNHDLILIMEREIQSLMKSYFSLNDWSSIENPDSSLSAELEFPVKALANILTFVENLISTADYLSFKKEISKLLSAYIISNIIHLNRFNHAGVSNLKYDVQHMWRQLALPKDESYRAINKELALKH